MLAEEARIRNEELTTQDSAFRHETVDPQWSATTLDVVESALFDMSISEHVQALECRATTCGSRSRDKRSAGMASRGRRTLSESFGR